MKQINFSINPASINLPIPGRRNFLKISAGILLASAFGGIPGCIPGKPLKIAAQVWPGYTFLYLGLAQGFISNTCLKLIKTEHLGESASALAKGEVDGAALTLDEVVHLLDQGLSLKVVLVLDISAGADVVMVAPAIKKPADLQGKRIGVESSSLGAIMLSKLLEANHLTHDLVQIVPMGFDHIKAWDDNKLDAVITYEPNANILEQKGLRRIWDSRNISGAIVDVLAVRSDVTHRHSSALTEIVTGHFKALGLWQNNPIDTMYLLGKILRIDPEDVKAAFMGLDLPDASFNRHYLTPPAGELTTAAAEIARIMAHDKLIRQIPAFDNLFIADFIPGNL